MRTTDENSALDGNSTTDGNNTANGNSTDSTTVVDVEESFTLVERQILYFYIEFGMQMITQQEYYASIEKLGYSIESVSKLVASKKSELK